jgi:hypothetical protein
MNTHSTFRLARLVHAAAWLCVALRLFALFCARQPEFNNPLFFATAASLGAGAGAAFGRPLRGALLGCILVYVLCWMADPNFRRF